MKDTPSPTPGPATSTKDKLAAVIGTFQDFDTTMRIGTRQRREKDEHRVSTLRSSMSAMETSLTSEIKRRIEMNKSIQTWCVKEISGMESKFNGIIEDRTKVVMERIEELSVRVDELNGRFEEERVRIPIDIEEKGRELADMLNAFQEEFTVEKNDRLEREARIEKQLDDHEHVVAEKFEAERTVRENKYTALSAQISVNEKSRIKSDTKFQQIVKEELQSLHNDVYNESKVREREDDEIVEALNRYTSKLQSSLTIINSTNT